MARKKWYRRKWLPDWVKPYVYNRYSLTTFGFLVWMTFFDKHDFLLQASYRSELNELNEEKQYYTDGINKNNKAMEELFSNQDNLEKFAREHYFMKKDNEDVFVFVNENNQLIKGKK